MDWMSSAFWSALLTIIVIDLVLAGDNAIVIGLSARTLPRQQQKKVIFWGTVGAVAIRSALTLVAVYLLMVPGLMAVGGLLLIWIAYKLIAEDKGHGDVKEAATFGEALRTVLIADTVMGMDNVLAVAGAAHGDFLLVVLGLLISVPIVVWGSTLILRLVERFPVIIYVGGGVLAFTAAKMVVGEKLFGFFDGNFVLTWGFTIAVVAGVLFAGYLKRGKAAAAS
ncbi:TerC family protein [Paenibacillus sp.]|uniref:TerC family protein n=1 Tax=Paenibacillus sp. TaxID=58172 RepID=UPI002D484585|nr:TerC family protein [Paenibacillus sp.]HZG55349.1 TerC family protein [Paenibacillus sp.]